MKGYFENLIDECLKEDDGATEKKTEKRNLYMIAGRFMAAQDLLDNQDIISIDILCSVLGLDLTQHKKNAAEWEKKRGEELKNV